MKILLHLTKILKKKCIQEIIESFQGVIKSFFSQKCKKTLILFCTYCLK